MSIYNGNGDALVEIYQALQAEPASTRQTHTGKPGSGLSPWRVRQSPRCTGSGSRATHGGGIVGAGGRQAEERPRLRPAALFPRHLDLGAERMAGDEAGAGEAGEAVRAPAAVPAPVRNQASSPMTRARRARMQGSPFQALETPRRAAADDSQEEVYRGPLKVPLRTSDKDFMESTAFAMRPGRQLAAARGPERQVHISLIEQPRALASVARYATTVLARVLFEARRGRASSGVSMECVLKHTGHILAGHIIAMCNQPDRAQDAALDGEEAAAGEEATDPEVVYEFCVNKVTAFSKDGKFLDNWINNSDITMTLRLRPEETRERVFSRLWDVPAGPEGKQRVHPAFCKGKAAQAAMHSLLRNPAASKVQWMWGKEEGSTATAAADTAAAGDAGQEQSASADAAVRAVRWRLLHLSEPVIDLSSDDEVIEID